MDALNYRILNTDGKEVGTMELAYSIFCAPVDEHLVHNVVVWQLAKARSGNHSTISKGEMRGGGKKPWRQKGTGRARVGSNNSPLWRHGAVTFGPKPRDYTKRITKAEK